MPEADPIAVPPAAQERTSLQTVRSLLPYLWPKGDVGAHVRVFIAVVMLVAAKVATPCWRSRWP